MAKRKKSNTSRKAGGGPQKCPADDAASSDERTKSVAGLRRQLDRIDSEILTAMNRRAGLAQQIGKLKETGQQGVYDPQREAEVLRHVVEGNAGPLSDEAVRAIYRELISGSRAVQTPMRIAYLGPEFTFSHLAAIERFGQSAELVPVGTIAAVFEEVERGHTQYGVVPMENSTDGRVSDTLDCFSRSTVRICGELPLRIHHCLLGTGTRDQILVVYSKPQPLSQCRNWLAKHVPSAKTTEVSSTAEAVQIVGDRKDDRENRDRFAAIASGQAGSNYGLPVIAANIEDNPDNITRFAVIGQQTGPRTGNDKTSLMLEIAHKPGALADAMAIFKRNRLNMTWIESFPIPGSRGRYLFFIEFVGHHGELRARRAIASLEKKAQRVVILGSYAQTEPVG
jgi:chorismate mutase/prephenate dehydratase